MKNILTGLFLISAFMLSSLTAQAGELPDYFKGTQIAKGKKMEWTPDGREIAYISGNTIFLYDLKKDISRKLVDMFVAEYAWINNDSMLAVEWPENVREREKVPKVVNYWIVERSGKKHLFASDTSVTSRIPDYNGPFTLPGEKIALRKNPGWQKSEFPQNDQIVVFAFPGFNINPALDHYFYPTWSKQERGSIHFKNIKKETIRTLATGENYYDPQLAPDRSKMFVYSDNSAAILDTNGNTLADFSKLRADPGDFEFKKFMGSEWDFNAERIAFFEIFNRPEGYTTISCFDLKTGIISVLTQSPFYGGDDLRFSPDGKLLAGHLVYNGIDYITLIALPEPKGEAVH